jgi:hypothetical protein
MPIVRQRLDKHIPEVTLSTIVGHPLLGNGPINMHSRQRKTVFSVGPVITNYKRAQSEEVARVSVVDWGSVLQAGRSPVRVPDEVEFFNLPKPSSRTMALGFT